MNKDNRKLNASKFDRFMLAVSPYVTVLTGAFLMLPTEAEKTTDDAYIKAAGAFLAAVGLTTIIASAVNKKNQKQR